MVVLLLVAGWWLNPRFASREVVFQPTLRLVEPAPMCPWREPEADLHRFFPGATGWRTEIRILSGRRLELQQRLGRAPEGEENSIYLNRALAGDRTVGTILTRRVKGEHGAMELVLAVDDLGQVAGLRLQRIREPAEIAAVIQSPVWLGSFSGKNAASDWRMGEGVPGLPMEARPSGEALVQSVRSLLILLQAAESGTTHSHS